MRDSLQSPTRGGLKRPQPPRPQASKANFQTASYTDVSSSLTKTSFFVRYGTQRDSYESRIRPKSQKITQKVAGKKYDDLQFTTPAFTMNRVDFILSPAAAKVKKILMAVQKISHAIAARKRVAYQLPAGFTGIAGRLRPLRNGVRIQKKAHSSGAAASSATRSISSPEPRNGEAAKKSASVPVRFVRRAHSSAETITAVVRPLRVMVCGPDERAKSTTSLNFAFASAIVHILAVMPVLLAPLWS